MSESVEKAKFITESGDIFDVQFNPTDIQLNASASWDAQDQVGNEVLLEFSKVEPRTLSMTLVFDTTTNNANVSKAYVNHLMAVFILKELPDDNLQSAVNAVTTSACNAGTGQGELKKGRNQLVTFSWGDFSFYGALTDLDTKFTMFSKQGHPLRAEVKVTMKEFKNSWDNSVGGERSNITVPQVKLVQLKPGQTLSSLASLSGMSVGSLAAMNGIADPLNMIPGQVIRLPGS